MRGCAASPISTYLPCDQRLLRTIGNCRQTELLDISGWTPSAAAKIFRKGRALRVGEALEACPHERLLVGLDDKGAAPRRVAVMMGVKSPNGVWRKVCVSVSNPAGAEPGQRSLKCVTPAPNPSSKLRRTALAPRRRRRDPLFRAHQARLPRGRIPARCRRRGRASNSCSSPIAQWRQSRCRRRRCVRCCEPASCRSTFASAARSRRRFRDRPRAGIPARDRKTPRRSRTWRWPVLLDDGDAVFRPPALDPIGEIKPAGPAPRMAMRMGSSPDRNAARKGAARLVRCRCGGNKGLVLIIPMLETSFALFSHLRRRGLGWRHVRRLYLPAARGLALETPQRLILWRNFFASSSPGSGPRSAAARQRLLDGDDDLWRLSTRRFISI